MAVYPRDVGEQLLEYNNLPMENALRVSSIESMVAMLDAGFGFHRDTDPALLERLQGALDILIQRGVLDRIMKDYIESETTRPYISPFKR